MKAKAPIIGLVAFGGISLVVMAVSAWLFAPRPTSARELAVAAEVTAPAEAADQRAVALAADVVDAAVAGPDDARAASLVEDLRRLWARSIDTREDETGRLEEMLVSMGDAAAKAIALQIDRASDGPARHRMFDLLRRVPGPWAERKLIEEARWGPSASSRSASIEALAERKSAAAIDALDAIAKSDPKVLRSPLMAMPRDPNDTSTDVPDEVVFTPRMHAMAALAATRDPRATDVLAQVLRDQPDESLRMEAARDLTQLTGQREATDALLSSAESDRSAYVRLAALHALAGSDAPAMASVLQRIALRDGDAGVRLLAQRLLDRARAEHALGR